VLKRILVFHWIYHTNIKNTLRSAHSFQVTRSRSVKAKGKANGF